ncbi:MAG: gtuS2-22 [Solirubrobacterales bacterium]|jgi:glycosyltransferase involved in cell wall biosynthesis|nr:gtuS2-22 [Solirubrobacterales bacterium]
MAAGPRVLFLSPDAVGARMAGLGIRYTELAGALTDVAQVRVATGDPEGDGTTLPGSAIPVVGYDPHAPGALRDHIAWADTIVAPPQWPLITSWLRSSAKRIVFDLYDPETLETLELFATRKPLMRRLMVALTLDRLDDALRTGHHFMCASEGQRDLWTGALLGARALTPDAYDADRSLRTTLDLVPFGLPGQPPVAGGPGVREAFPGRVGPDDEIVLWNGGIWPWLDAPSAVAAVAALAARRPGVKLVFMGKGSGFAGQAAFEATQDAARTLGALDTTVLFSDGWVPYDERAGWLLQADCALATAGDHLETRFAFRTRLLDCFWAGLPVVCTNGDDLAVRVARDNLGAVAAPGDVAGLASAIESVLDRGRAAHADALAAVAADYAWPVVAAPLRRWVTSERPPVRLGEGAASRRPAHAARNAGYRGVRAVLAATRIGWPSL